MSIGQDIQSFTKKLNVKFAMAHYLKLYDVARAIQRFLKKELESGNRTEFTSQDLRSLVIAVEKVHKIVNKKISFVEFQRSLEKHKKIDGVVLGDETKKFACYCQVAKYLQSVRSMVNHSATLKFLLELSREQDNEKSDKEFNDSVICILLECMGRTDEY